MQHQERFIQYVRGLEQEVRLYQDDNAPLQRAIWDLHAEIEDRTTHAEQRGYDRGVSDMRSQGFCVEPEKT